MAFKSGYPTYSGMHLGLESSVFKILYIVWEQECQDNDGGKLKPYLHTMEMTSQFVSKETTPRGIMNPLIKNSR